MKNTVAIMVALDLKYPDVMGCIKVIADRFTRLNNIPVRIIVESDVKDVTLVLPEFARYYAWQLVPKDTERIIYFDYDILPVRKLPMLPNSDFAAIREKSKLADYAMETTPVLNEAKLYFNTGFFIAGRKFELICDRVLARQTALVSNASAKDQTIVNVEVQTAVRMGEIGFEELSNQWCMAAWDITLQSDPYMAHYISLTNSEIKPRIVSVMANRLNQLEQQIGE